MGSIFPFCLGQFKGRTRQTYAESPAEGDFTTTLGNRILSVLTQGQNGKKEQEKGKLAVSTAVVYGTLVLSCFFTEI